MAARLPGRAGTLPPASRCQQPDRAPAEPGAGHGPLGQAWARLQRLPAAVPGAAACTGAKLLQQVPVWPGPRCAEPPCRRPCATFQASLRACATCSQAGLKRLQGSPGRGRRAHPCAGRQAGGGAHPTLVLQLPPGGRQVHAGRGQPGRVRPGRALAGAVQRPRSRSAAACTPVAERLQLARSGTCWSGQATTPKPL